DPADRRNWREPDSTKHSPHSEPVAMSTAKAPRFELGPAGQRECRLPAVPASAPVRTNAGFLDSRPSPMYHLLACPLSYAWGRHSIRPAFSAQERPEGWFCFGTRTTKMADPYEPAFLAYLEAETGGKPVKPDDEDFDLKARPVTEAEQAHEYRLAQARKILRLHKEWKANQN